MIPGGHVEANENPAQTAVREVREEAGISVQLIALNPLRPPGLLSDAVVVAPLWIVEEDVPPERREPLPHIHIDHLYLGVADAGPASESAAEDLGLRWCPEEDLDKLDLFENTLLFGRLLFGVIGSVTGRP